MLIYLAMLETDAEKAKFEIIYNEYKNLMYYVANKILNNKSDSEDVVHQAFLKVIENIHKINEPKCPQTRSLVVIITERKAIDLYRQHKAHAGISIDEDTVQVAVRSDIDSYSERSLVAAAIAKLPERYRQLLLLKYDSGFSEHEIGELLSMTDANVKKTIQRAKTKLAAILNELEVEQ